jgi:Rieske [2Fe-2S] domain
MLLCSTFYAYVCDIQQCSYHGWQFEGDGQCAVIPQASDAAAANAAQSSRRLAHNSTEALFISPATAMCTATIVLHCKQYTLS